jgi:hypothetical protein
MRKNEGFFNELIIILKKSDSIKMTWQKAAEFALNEP